MQFDDYLISKGCTDANDLEGIHSPNEFREVLGAIALRHQLMTPDEIDDVLLRSHPDQSFEEVALSLGYLTESDVQRLHKCRELESAIQIGVRLILTGNLQRDELLTELLAYFQDQQS